MHCWNFSSNVGRVAGLLQDPPLAFALTVVMRVADSTSLKEPGSMKVPN